MGDPEREIEDAGLAYGAVPDLEEMDVAELTVLALP